MERASGSREKKQWLRGGSAQKETTWAVEDWTGGCDGHAGKPVPVRGAALECHLVLSGTLEGTRIPQQSEVPLELEEGRRRNRAGRGCSAVQRRCRLTQMWKSWRPNGFRMHPLPGLAWDATRAGRMDMRCARQCGLM